MTQSLMRIGAIPADVLADKLFPQLPWVDGMHDARDVHFDQLVAEFFYRIRFIYFLHHTARTAAVCRRSRDVSTASHPATVWRSLNTKITDPPDGKQHYSLKRWCKARAAHIRNLQLDITFEVRYRVVQLACVRSRCSNMPDFRLMFRGCAYNQEWNLVPQRNLPDISKRLLRGGQLQHLDLTRSTCREFVTMPGNL